MPEYIDALAACLAELQEQQSLPWSRVGATAREALRGLLESGAIARVRAGRGERVMLVQPETLDDFIAHRYPYGLVWRSGDGRADAIRHTRSAKRGRRSSRFSTVVVRVLGKGALTIAGFEGDLCALTKHAGAAAIVLGRGSEPSCHGVVATVENEDVFHRVEEILPWIDVAVFTAGKISERLVEWLSHQEDLERVVHAGDYDPVGVADYLRLRTRLGKRVQLYIPPDIEALFERYSDPGLLRKSGNQRAMAAVRASQDAQAQQVSRLIQRYGAGLEQEILLDRFDAARV